MTIAILGGAGYLGSHTVKYLQAAGASLAVYDQFNQGQAPWFPAGVPVVRGAMGDAERLRAFFKAHSIQTVMHFAARIDIGESVREPRRYYQNNLSETLVLLDTMLDCGIRELIFSSTCAIYGNPQFLPLTEAHPYAPLSPYGRTKLAIEYALADYAQAYDFKYISLRYFNASGADPDGLLGECHEPETHLIPLVLQVAQGQLPQLQVFGHDYPTPDGTCIRDYIHVWDLAQAHWLALQYLRERPGSEVFNLGNGRGYSVLEVVQAAEAVSGCPVPICFGPRRAGDPAVLIGSSQKAGDLLHWQPQYTDLNSILETAWRWQQQ